MFKLMRSSGYICIVRGIVLMASFVASVGFAVSADTVTLTIIHPWVGAEEEGFRNVLAVAEEALGVKIEPRVIRPGDLLTLLPTQWAAGTAPGDLIFHTEPRLIMEGAAKGHVLDITGLLNPEEFLPGSLDPLMLDGKLYGAPYTRKLKPPGFWYRKSFFEAHGLTEPTNWAEFLALLEKISGVEGIEAPIASPDGRGWPLSDITEHFLIGFGGPQLHKELTAGTISWTDPVVKAILESRLCPLIEAGYFDTPVEAFTAIEKWWKGDYALLDMLTALIAVVEDPSDLGLFLLPGAMGIPGSTDYLFVSSHTAHPDEARTLFKWLVTEGQKVQVQQGGHFATYKLVPLEFYPPTEREVAAKVAGLVPLPDMDDAIGGEFKVAFWDQLKLLWVSPKSLPDVLAVLEEKAPKAP